MTSNRWLLPEGIDEVLPLQAARLERLRRQLLDLYAGWGYELIMPPFIEYLDSLLTGTGNDLDLQTFKLTDQLTGRMMGVRADMTPQAARIDAHRLQRDTPVRLCYLGTVLRTRPDGFAGSRSPLQVGAELFGHAGVESDLEILALMLETLDATGVQGAHIDLGHVGIYRSLLREAALPPETAGLLFDALQRKARVEIESLLADAAISETARIQLAALAELNGGAECLDAADKVLRGAPADVHAALDNLRRLVAGLAKRRPALPVHLDLAELRGYHYHTGAVFAAFVPGHGKAAVQGGRYDDIGRVFGRARPATGFSADLKTLMMLADVEAQSEPAAIFAPCTDDAQLDAEVRRLRAVGERVIRALPGQVGGEREMGCDRMLVKNSATWAVVAVKY
ncbi:MAG: ATP phosphoribosyltransferase regulatory subunit [Gammaproteobacteria bacterium]